MLESFTQALPTSRRIPAPRDSGGDRLFAISEVTLRRSSSMACVHGGPHPTSGGAPVRLDQYYMVAGQRADGPPDDLRPKAGDVRWNGSRSQFEKMTLVMRAGVEPTPQWEPLGKKALSKLTDDDMARIKANHHTRCREWILLLDSGGVDTVRIPKQPVMNWDGYRVEWILETKSGHYVHSSVHNGGAGRSTQRPTGQRGYSMHKPLVQPSKRAPPVPPELKTPEPYALRVHPHYVRLHPRLPDISGGSLSLTSVAIAVCAD